MSMKHTPGPWMYEIDGPLTNDMRHAVLAKSTGLWVAATYRSGTQAENDKSMDADDEAKANARLIAAAPDMLAALLLITQADPCIAKTTDDELRAAMEDEGEEQEVRDQARAFLVARASIAKATGGHG